MAKQHIEKTLIIMDEDEVRQVLRLARRNDPQEIFRFVKEVIAKKVEAALRMRCGQSGEMQTTTTTIIGGKMLTQQTILEALRPVIDPEIGLSLYFALFQSNREQSLPT